VSEAATPGDRRFSIGIVGAGSIVRDAHLPVLAAGPRWRPAWVTDANDGAARRAAERYGMRAVPAAGAPADLPPADIVLVAIPHGARAPYLEALSARDGALYVEKPVAATVAEHRRLVESCGEPWRVAHGLQRRSFGPTRLARQLVDDSPFGALVSVRAGFGRPGGGRYGGFRADPRLSGGGILLEHGIHLLDSVLFLTRAVAASVHDVRMTLHSGLDVHTELELTLDRGSGDEIPCSLCFSWLCETETGVSLRFERADLAYSIYDRTGRLRVSVGGSRHAYRVAPEWHDPLPLAPLQVLYEHWSDVTRALAERRPNHTSAVDSILTTEVVEACYDRGRGETARAAGDR